MLNIENIDLFKMIKETSKEIEHSMKLLRQELHSNAELSFKEFKTSQIIKQKLTEYNIDFVEVATTGVVAYIKSTNPKKQKNSSILLRGDIDALPIKENTGLKFSSTTCGVMHACGHDIHTTSLIGTLIILKKNTNRLEADIVALFQPGEEEFPGGASIILKDGILDKENIKMAMAFHVASDLNVGTFGFREGKYMASGDEIHITVKGKGGHGALPYHCNDTVLASSQIVVSLQQIVSRIGDPRIPTVLSFGKFIAEGSTNILPSSVTIAGTFRTFDEIWREQAKLKIRNIAENVAKSYGCTAEVVIKDGYPSVFNNPSLTKEAKRLSQTVWGEEAVIDLDIRMTTEDFGYIAKKYPSLFFRVGVKNSTNTTGDPHTDSFNPDEDSLYFAIAEMTILAINFSNNGL